MKWVKVAIGAVIAILSIGIVATSVYDMTKDKIIQDGYETIEVEVLASQITTAPVFNITSYDIRNSEYTDLHELFTDYFDDASVYKVTGLTINGNPVTQSISLSYNSGSDYTVQYVAGGQGYNLTIKSDVIEGARITSTVGTVYIFETNVPKTITVPAQISGINATLLLLTPLIFAGGVLAYLLNKQNY